VFFSLDIIHIKVIGLLLIGCLGFVASLLLKEKDRHFLTKFRLIYSD